MAKASKEEKVLKDIGKAIKTYEEQKKEEDDGPITKADLDKFLVKLNENRVAVQDPSQAVMQNSSATPSVKPNVKQSTNKQQIAFQLWKDSKATSIICIIAIVCPMLSSLITMAAGATAGLILALVGLVYPCMVFVRMAGLQAELYKKYGLKPLFQLQQQNRAYADKKQVENKNKDMEMW